MQRIYGRGPISFPLSFFGPHHQQVDPPPEADLRAPNMASIHEAVEVGDLAEVRRLLEEDPGLLQAPDESGFVPLMRAVGGGHIEVVAYCLDRGAEVNHRHGTAHVNAAFWACSHGYPAILRLLLDQGADPCVRAITGWTPLAIAAHRGHMEVVAMLLKYGLDQLQIDDADREGATAVLKVAARGRTEVLRMLRRQGPILPLLTMRGRPHSPWPRRTRRRPARRSWR